MPEGNKSIKKGDNAQLFSDEQPTELGERPRTSCRSVCRKKYEDQLKYDELKLAAV